MALTPTLVALTSSPDAQVASKGYSALALLHQKHASMLASRYIDAAQAAHSYARSAAEGEVARGELAVGLSVRNELSKLSAGFYDEPPVSRLGRWYK